MVTLMVFNEVFLTVENAVAADDYALPVLARFMHPHLVLLPVRFGLEGLLRLLLGAIRAEHVGLARQILGFVVGERRSSANVVGWSDAWFDFQIKRTAVVRGGC